MNSRCARNLLNNPYLRRHVTVLNLPRYERKNHQRRNEGIMSTTINIL